MAYITGSQIVFGDSTIQTAGLAAMGSAFLAEYFSVNLPTATSYYNLTGFTISSAGYYFITGGYQAITLSAARYQGIALTVNGVLAVENYTSGVINNNQSCSIYYFRYCNAGDVLYVQARSSGAGNYASNITFSIIRTS